MKLEKEIDLTPLCKVYVIRNHNDYFYIVSFTAFGQECLCSEDLFSRPEDALSEAMFRIDEWRKKFIPRSPGAINAASLKPV